ncbi:hypothetical protein C5167_031295 [Papaver somniferum]|nr:hypothetical protein C5167_031295 [Papaver somniferum]
MRSPSVEKVLQKSRRMMFDFVEIMEKGRREDYDYSDANRLSPVGEIISC